MYLSKIEIFGFKSFPDKTTIEFGNGVSAIVGPNGSGKSNIVDAIRWVLGEQGDRALRSERREDVVFSGTRLRKPLSVAEVSLTIQNNKNILPTEYNEVQIARRFFRNGDTEYFLNGTKVRLKDIRHLFVDTGIGPDAYSVIELKMVETILSSVKNERRKLFEEAAGIVSYKQNRDLTIKRLDGVHEDLTRVNDVIREKQRNLNSLERQVRRNEEAKIISEELRLLEIIVYSYDYKLYIDEIQEIRDHEAENIDLKKRLSNEITEYDAKYDMFRNEIEKLEKSLREFDDDMNIRKGMINDLERFNLVTEQKIKNYENNVKRLDTETANLIESIKRNDTRAEELSSKISILDRTIEISEISLNEKKEKLDRTTEIMKSKKLELVTLGSKLIEVNKRVNEDKANYDKNKMRLDNNLSRMKLLSEENEKNLHSINGFESEKNDYGKKLKSISEDLRKSEMELASKIKEKNEFTSRIEEKEKELNELKLELQKTSSLISHLKNLVETFDDYSEGIKYLVKYRKNDFVRTVIDTIEVEDKYKVAIETALGEVSNYLVVSDSRQLNKLIETLVSADKGKVTFILNEKLNFGNLFLHQDWEHQPDYKREKGVIGFADRFVKCVNPENEMLIRYLLDEYIIVEDIDTAFRLSKDNYYKFITLDGDIVTESVIRAGGKIKEESIRLGRENQISKIDTESKSIIESIRTIEDGIASLKEKSGLIDIAGSENLCTELEKQKNEVSREMSMLSFKVDELNKSITANDKTYGDIQAENKELTYEINRLIEVVNKNENEQANTEKELSFLTGEFNDIEQEYSLLLNDYNSYNLELTKIKNEYKTEMANLNRAVSSREHQLQQIEKNKVQVEEESYIIIDLKTKVQKNEDTLGSVNDELRMLLKDYSGIKTQYDGIRSDQNTVDNERRGKRVQFDRVSQVLIDSQIKIKENEIKSEQAYEYVKKKYEMELFTDFEELKNKEEYFKVLADFLDTGGIFDLTGARRRVDDLFEQYKKLGGYQELVWQDFQSDKEELQKMIDQRADLLESEKDLRKTIEKINIEARDRFLKTFEQIRQNFIDIFKELFQEGDEANLKLNYDVDDEGKIIDDPLEAKIEIVAKPRGKRPTSIELLSGGEKTLTAIALLFSIYLVKPSPFCILDEVDAPLDPANLVRFNKMIRKFSDNTQFILITHNERTMERVDRLYGVTMQEVGVTTIVETKFKN